MSNEWVYYDLVCCFCGNAGSVGIWTEDWFRWKTRWLGFSGRSSPDGPIVPTLRCLKCKKHDLELTKRAATGTASGPNQPGDRMADTMPTVLPKTRNPSDPRITARPKSLLGPATGRVLTDHERLACLRARLASARKEKEALASEIASSSMSATRRRQAARRYSAVMVDCGRVAQELRELVFVAKHAENR